jgi:hypothetical protein
LFGASFAGLLGREGGVVVDRTHVPFWHVQSAPGDGDGHCSAPLCGVVGPGKASVAGAPARAPLASPLSGAIHAPARQFHPVPGDGVMQPPGPLPFGASATAAMPATHTPFWQIHVPIGCGDRQADSLSPGARAGAAPRPPRTPGLMAVGSIVITRTSGSCRAAATPITAPSTTAVPIAAR